MTLSSLTVPVSVSVLSLVWPPLVMVVVEPVSVKIVLLSDSAGPPLVMVVIESVSVPPIFSIWSALVTATAVADVVTSPILRSEANEDATGRTAALSIVPNTSSVPPAEVAPTLNLPVPSVVPGNVECAVADQIPGGQRERGAINRASRNRNVRSSHALQVDRISKTGVRSANIEGVAVDRQRHISIAPVFPTRLSPIGDAIRAG